MANGLAKAFNKVICKILKKMVSKNKKEWSEKLQGALWAYRTTIRGPTYTTPFSLVYRLEAVLPLEVKIPSLHVAMQGKFSTQQNAESSLQELESQDERRLASKQSIELYKAKSSISFGRMVRYLSFKKGDLVLTVKWPMKMTHKCNGPDLFLVFNRGITQ